MITISVVLHAASNTQHSAGVLPVADSIDFKPLKDMAKI
jgi:hypothetical protein